MADVTMGVSWMDRPGLIGERAFGLFLVALLLLNPPILTIFSAEAFLFGMPLLYVYLFSVWGGVIALIGLHAFAARPRRGEAGDDAGHRGN